MAIKVRDPWRYMRLKAGESIELYGDERRTVRLDVNTAERAQLFLHDEGGNVLFLCAVDGLETVDFVAEGRCQITPVSDGDVYVYTDDGKPVQLVIEDKVSFATPHQRRGEAEEQIYMRDLMLANQARRMAQLEAIAEAAQRRADQLEAEANEQSTGGDTEPVSGEQEQEEVGGTSDT